MGTSITGAEILLHSLSNHGVNTIFGYPGSCVMAVLDSLYTYKGSIKHILVRHEQGALHAAQGYAQVSDRVGVALLTSGPGATNAVTGIADAMANSTPLVVITGQVHSRLLGTDAFQEVDILGITHSITKWVYQVRTASEISSAIAHGFYIASTGRPGPILLDITKDAQTEKAAYTPQKVEFIRSYIPKAYQREAQSFSSSSDEDGNAAAWVVRILETMRQDLIIVLDTKHIVESNRHKIVKSEKFGTMGFGLPAAIGAKYAEPGQTVCLVADSAQFQTTIQELGVIMQSGIDIKIILLNDKRNMQAPISNPDFMLLVDAYNIERNSVSESEHWADGIQGMLNSKNAYLLEMVIDETYSKKA